MNATVTTEAKRNRNEVEMAAGKWPTANRRYK